MHFDLLNIALVVLLFGGLVAVVTRPVYAVYAYLVVLFFFPNVGWGVVDKTEVMNLYGRGTGLFFFSIINLYLYGLFVLSAYYWGRKNVGMAACNLQKYFYYFALLFGAQVIAGMALGAPLPDIFSHFGIINIVNMGMFTAILIMAIDSPREAQRLSTVILYCATLRGIYGMLRYLFWGGDVANVYGNVQKIAIHLTFFDINDSILACLAAFIAGWRYLDKAVPLRHKPFYGALVVLQILIVALSYRRTGWGGLVVAAALFCFLQPLRRRVALIVGGAVAGGFALTMLVVQRFSSLSAHRNRGVMDMLLYDVKPGVKAGRFAELFEAFKTVSEHIFLGVGSWAGYGPGHIQFMHSGLIHVWLKAGLVGLVPFLLLYVSFGYFGLRRINSIPWSNRDLYGAGLAGILFTLPNLFMGTPIIEFRTMQMTALCLALPYLVFGNFAGGGTVTARVTEAAPLLGKPQSDFAFARQKLIDLEKRPASVPAVAERAMHG